MSGADLDRQCLQRLKPVRFGLYSFGTRTMSTIRTVMAQGVELSPRQRLAMYALCWRYRDVIADARFTARVLIAERKLVERAEVTELLDSSVSVRAWRGDAADPVATTGG
jgi:hypothetical protein